MNANKDGEENKIHFGLARSLARSLLKKVQIKEPPILLRTIFGCLDHKITIEGKDLGKDCGFSIGTSNIIYNSSHPRTRTRFTLAHELGHILLGHNSSSRIISFESTNPEDILANEFAAELLAPLSMLKREEFFSSSLTELAHKYQVSKEMMMWRLKSTGLYMQLLNWR